jgi:hypothetical protein
MAKFQGLIQHSFALRLGDEHEPFDGRSIRAALEERFALGQNGGTEFHVKSLNEVGRRGDAIGVARHSPLVEDELTTVRPKRLDFLAQDAQGRRCESCGNCPSPLAWAKPGESNRSHGKDAPCGRLQPSMLFAELDVGSGDVTENDFLVGEIASGDCHDQAECVGRALLEAIAFRRSQLFGLATANRFVNVMLPSADLSYMGEGIGERSSSARSRDLILQPLLSLVRDGRDRRGFRQMYSLAFFVIPVEGKARKARSMSLSEVASNVNAGWTLADHLPERMVPGYGVSGSLRTYLERLLAREEETIRNPLRSHAKLSLRQVCELAAFGIAIRMAQGWAGEASSANKLRIGDDVVTSLGTARVSAAILIDSALELADVRTPIIHRNPPGSLDPLMETLSSEARTPTWTKTTRRRYQLDRPFIDGSDYAIGLVPGNRCLLITNAKKGRQSPESLLSRVAAITYMTLGAATAIETMRSIDRALEDLEHEAPRKIAEIDAEIATDLNEIYDLDIARETYRQLYRRLRDRLGITSDYKILQDKMETLYRATSTFHAEREQKQLLWLTAAIVALSLLILIGTIVVAAK